MRLKTQLVLFILCTLTLTSCKSRDFNTELRGKIDNPDGRQSPCLETLNPKAPYTPEVLIQQLTASINQAAVSKTFERENYRDLLFSDDVVSAAKGSLKSEVLNGDSCSLVRSINESMNKPSHFYWLTGNGKSSYGGMALYKGDVFAEGFYRNRSSGVESSLFARKKYSQDELLNRQPWFEWSPQTKKFTARLGSPAQRIISQLSTEQSANAITLHRGTNPKFADKGTALATLNSFLFGSTTGGIFSTPSFENAKGWASPVVLTARVNPKTLMEAAASQQSDNQKTASVYVGIEFGYVEVAFLYAAGDKSNLFFDNIVNKCVVSDKAQGTDFSFAPPCK